MKTQSSLILPFESPLATLALVGGKGANLSILAGAGFPVPGGFLVTTDAYHAFVAENHLDAAIAQALATVQSDNPASLEATSSLIRQQFTSGRMPKALQQAIVDFYQKLGRPAVAVR